MVCISIEIKVIAIILNLLFTYYMNTIPVKTI